MRAWQVHAAGEPIDVLREVEVEPPERRHEAAGFWIPHLTAWVGLVERGRIADGRTRSAVTATPTFAELPAARQRLADRAVVGKLVLVL